MKRILGIIALLASQIASMAADGVLQNVGGTTIIGGALGTAGYSNSTAFAAAQSGTILTNGHSVAAGVSNAFTFKDSANATVTVSNGTIQAVNLTNTGNIQAATLRTTGTIQINGVATFSNNVAVDGAHVVTIGGFSSLQAGTVNGNDATVLRNLSTDFMRFDTWSGSRYGIMVFSNQVLHVLGNAIIDTNVIVGGTITATNSFASFATTSVATIAATGWTNTFGINATVYVTATAISWIIKDRSQTTLYTSPTLTATMPIILQPGWAITAASGLSGTALPF